MKLHNKILIGLIAGAVVGVGANFVAARTGSPTAVELVRKIEPVGTAFIRLITMIVVPLVVASLMVGAASLGNLATLGRIGGKTIAYYLSTTAIAVTIGLVLSNIIAPGSGISPEALEGRDVVTLECIPEEQRQILARAFVQEGAIQCGYCIPGIVVRAAALLSSGRAKDRDAVAKALSGHLCRCTGYVRILDAIQTAGEMWQDGGDLARTEPRHSRFFGEDFGLKRTSEPGGGPAGGGVGSSSARYRGLEHALGEKDYIADLTIEGMLHGAAVLSEYPRAKVVRIDAANVLALPGVERVFTAEDVVGERNTGLVTT